jgi:hypothetical protein
VGSFLKLGTPPKNNGFPAPKSPIGWELGYPPSVSTRCRFDLPAGCHSHGLLGMEVFNELSLAATDWWFQPIYLQYVCMYIYIIMLHNYICTWVCLKIGYQMIQWFIIIFPKRGMQCTPSSSKPLNPEPGQGVAMTSIQHDTSSSPNGEIHENQVWVPPFSVKPVLSGPIDFPMVRPTWVT